MRPTFLGRVQNHATQFTLRDGKGHHITDTLKRIGNGAHVYKVDTNRAFWHVHIDPHNFDLLRLK